MLLFGLKEAAERQLTHSGTNLVKATESMARMVCLRSCRRGLGPTAAPIDNMSVRD